MFKLTKRQISVLEFLRDNNESDMVYDKGAGWWIGNERTNGKLALGLIRLCLVVQSQGNNMGEFSRWGINESGRRALRNQPPYCLSDGTYVSNLSEVFVVDNS